jgi:hypothetical protein
MVAAELTDLGRDDLADDLTMLVSELVANGVMHARTELLLTLDRTVDGVRLGVADGSRFMPRFAGSSAQAISGRGLLIVDRLGSRWGIDRLPQGGKVVWVEVDEPSAVGDDWSPEDLIEVWSQDDEASPSAIAVRVDIAVRDLLDSRRETDDRIREVQLLVLDSGATAAPRTPAAVIALADRLDEAVVAFGDARRQIQDQALQAARGGHEEMTLQLQLEPDAGSRALAFVEVLEAADALTAEGTLLLPPSTDATKAVRRQYVDAIVQQLAQRRAAADGRAAAGSDERDDAADDRDSTADRRDAIADGRDLTADTRDATADARDALSASQESDVVSRMLSRALEHNVSGQRRDRAAAARDDDSRSRSTEGNGPASWPVDTSGGGTDWQSAVDRARAGRDRDAAARDRTEVIASLQHAAAGQEAAAEQRGTAAVDREESEGERLSARHDRAEAAEDRAQADRGRSDAAARRNAPSASTPG